MFRFGDPGGRIYTSVGTSNVNLLAHWTSVGGGSWSVTGSGGRNGGSCLSVSTLNSNSYISKTLTSRATWGIAFAFKTASAGGSGGTSIIILLDNGTVQIDLRILPDFTLQFTRNGTNIGSPSTKALSLNSWYHIEIKGTIDPSAGSIECRINGVAVIGPTGSLNTRASANSTANQIILGNISGSGTNALASWDDIIVWDTQTTDANGFTDISDFIGDCGLTWLLPTGAGTTTQFTPDSGSNYARVNETTPDSDTSYVSDATVGHIDTYAMADLGGTIATVKSIASVHYARKDDVGSRGMKAELRSASANTAHATEISLSNSYQYYFNNWGQNPNNGSAINWTPTTINSLEAGQTVSS